MTEIDQNNKKSRWLSFKKVLKPIRTVFVRKPIEETNRSQKPRSRFVRILFESFSSVLTLTLIGLVSLTVLMNRETVDLAFFKPHYEQWFSQAFEGHSTEIEDYSARWIQGNREIELTAKNIQITGENNVAETIGVVKGVFSVGTDLTAMPSLKSLKIDGGALTIVRSDTGQVRLGLGTPSTFDKVAPIWSSESQSSSGEDGSGERNRMRLC